MRIVLYFYNSIKKKNFLLVNAFRKQTTVEFYEILEIPRDLQIVNFRYLCIKKVTLKNEK